MELLKAIYYFLVLDAPFFFGKGVLGYIFTSDWCIYAFVFYTFIIIWLIPVSVNAIYSSLHKIPHLQKYKIQHRESSQSEISLEQSALKKLLITRSSAVFLVACYASFNTESVRLWLHYQAINSPSAEIGMLQLVLSIIIIDTFQYFTHRIFHHPWLYCFHKDHHAFTKPSSISVVWVSAIEGFFITNPIVIAPIIIFNMHIITASMWIVMASLHGYYHHCGYDLPFNPLQLIPFANTVRMHDEHHRTSKGNYGLYYTFWDRLLGTYIDKI